MRNKRCFFFITLLLCVTAPLLSVVAQAATNVAYVKVKSAGVWMNVVTANLNSPDVRITPMIARRGIGTQESFRSMLRRTRPAAAINGTFFCTRTLRPIGDIVIDGQLMCRGIGSGGTAITIDYNNNVTFVPSRRPDLYEWSSYDRVMVAGPTLLLRGQTCVFPRAQGFDSGVHYSRQIRSAVGLTSTNKLLLVTTTRRVYMSQLAKAMKEMKCVDAAGLDGGSSTGLYWQGKLLRNPGRGMTNSLLVYNDLGSYNKNTAAFYPKVSQASAAIGSH